MTRIKLIRVHEQLYVADAAPVDLGSGREKILSFITSAPSQATDLQLDKVFGGLGSVAVISAPRGSSWKTDRKFINNIARTTGCVFALVKFDENLEFTIDEKLVAPASGSKWIVANRAVLRPEFGKVGANIPVGASLSLQKNGTELQIDVPATLPIDLDGFSMYGATPWTRQLVLSFLPEDPGRLNFKLDIAVSVYNKDQAMLGLQYFRGVQEPLGSSAYQFNRLHYPLFSLPPSAGATTVRLAASLDLREPSPGDVAGAMFRSTVSVEEIIRNGLMLDEVPLNQFAADGTRLFTTRSSVKSNLTFHFATVPTRMTSRTSPPSYNDVVLLPHGSVDLKSSSGSLLGASLLERVSSFDTLVFDLQNPAQALDARLYAKDGSWSKTVDTKEHPDAYLSMYAITSAARYLADRRTPTVKFSPDRLALYSLDSKTGAYRAIECDVPHQLPISPMDFGEAVNTNTGRSTFDTTVIAKHRAGIFGRPVLARASHRLFAFRQPEESSSTPQGFKVKSAGMFWEEIEFARGENWRIALDFGSDAAVAAELQRAFLEKEIFIVARRLPAVASATKVKPTLSLAFIGSNWEFRTSIVSAEPAPAAPREDESPLVIIKFGSRSVVDLVEDTASWTSTADFIGNPPDVAAVQARIRKVLGELKTDHEAESKNKKTSDTFAGPFVNPKGQIGKLLDANWNGVVMMSLPMPTEGKSPFPADLQPILDGYRGRIHASVLCADLRPAVAGKSEPSQVLALVRYLNLEAPTITNGNDPDCSGGFDLLLLKVRLRATLVEKFECRLSLRIDKFFGQDFSQDGVLIGAYDRRLEGGRPIDVYTFSLETILIKTWNDGSFLTSATLTRLGYERAEPEKSEPSGRFLINGSLDFDLDHVGVKGLQFDRLGIEFGSQYRTFSFKPGLLKVSVDPKYLNKLLGKLPFRLTSFVFGRLDGSKFLSLDKLGFEPLFGSGGTGKGLFSYAFTFDLDLGSLGALSKKLEGFKGELILGWLIVSGKPELSLGFKLTGNKGGPLDFSLLDVIQVRAKQFGFGQLRNGKAYYIYAAGLELRLLDQTFPARGADQSIFVFYPNTSGSVAWLYARVDGNEDSVIPLFAIGQRIEVDNLGSSRTTLAGITAIKKVFKETLEPSNLPYDGTSGVRYNPKADWLLGLEARVFDVATLQLLIAEPDLYGARVTISKKAFKFLKDDWFFDLLYRRLDEDTGIFSLEVPPPVDMLDFGAVQVILPTIRGEVGTPGNHILVDLGYPGKKSIAAWQRTGKVVAGIFGGDGGFYLGRVAPRTFPVQLMPEYEEVYEFKKDSCFMVGMAGSFGLMRYFSSGPMSGHASLTGFFMLEGALATIQTRPNTLPGPALEKPPSIYLRLEGQFGIKGCIEASADFKLITVSFGLEFKIYFAFQYETWKGIVFSAGIMLSAYGRLVIANIRIPFDGSFEIALEFRFSFEAKFDLRLSNDDPRWEGVFKYSSIVSPSSPMLASGLPIPTQVRPVGKISPYWTWPSPTLRTLGYKVKNPLHFWFVAVSTLADATAMSGRRLPGVVGHLIAGEHPTYVNSQNSVLAVADALLRWMLPQVKGLAEWDGATRIKAHDSDLMNAHMLLQPEGRDSRLEEVTIPAELMGYDPEEIDQPGIGPKKAGAGVRLVSPEGNIAKSRPGFKGLTHQSLFDLYSECFNVQVSLPKNHGDKEKQEPLCIPFPLPPLFELSYVVQSPDVTNWKTLKEVKRDLSSYRPLSEREVDELQQQLDKFHALLKAERELSAAMVTTRPMQEWIFLSWHQLFCSELLRQAMDTLKLQGGETTFEQLREKMVTDPMGPAYIAAQSVSRLFAGGLRFTLSGKPEGSFSLAGTLFDTPELVPGERALLCLKESGGGASWPLNADHVAACTEKGLPSGTLGFDVTELTRESDFVVPNFTLTRPKGYEDLPREFPLSELATMGGDPVYAFPKELVLALLSSKGLVIEWKARGRNERNELEDLNSQPLSPKSHTALKLRGIGVVADNRSFEISLLPLALEERELVHALAAEPQASLRIGYRLASGPPETAYAELTVENLKALSAFRVDVSSEERPTVRSSGSPLPYYAHSSQELIALMSAWAKTGSRTCRMTVPLPPGGENVAIGKEVEVLLLSNSDPGMYRCHRLGNAITGAVPEGATWFGITTNVLRRMPASPPEAILVEARRNPMSQALVRVPTRLRPVLGGNDWVPIGQLRDLKESMAFGSSPESVAFKKDFHAFVLQADAQASHFDLLALQVKVNGVERIGFETSLPLTPRTEKVAQVRPYLEQSHFYQGFVPVKLLLGAGASPYDLVGKRIEVLGRLRDHYGQQAPHDPIQVLDRPEEYRDEIAGPDAWEHITAFLRSTQNGVSLVLRASVRACWLESHRADFIRRRLGLIRHQLEDGGLKVSAQWCFGDRPSTTIDKKEFVEKLIGSLEKSLIVEPKNPFVELITPLALPALPGGWDVEPFAAVLRMTRSVRTSAFKLLNELPVGVLEATAALDPEGISVKGSTDSVDALQKFFKPVVALFDADLAVCDPALTHGSYFLVNPKCISGEFLKDDDGFHAILPFANKPVSIEKSDATVVDRDLDATLVAACESLDSVLGEKRLDAVRNAVPSLLSLKRQFAVTCGDRLRSVFTGQKSPEASRRAVEDAVSQRASECWRLASIAELAVKPYQSATSSALLKIVGDFQDPTSPAPSGAPKKSLPVSTIGIICGAVWRIPVIAWMGGEPGLVSVPALNFTTKHVLVDLSRLKSLAPAAAGTVWLRLVDVGTAKVEFTLPAFTAPAPLRRVLETPVASGHVAVAVNPKPQTVAETKLWNYSATYAVPGKGLQKETDVVYVSVKSPQGDRSLTHLQTPEQLLLLSADRFIAAARPDTTAATYVEELGKAAEDLMAKLVNFKPLNSLAFAGPVIAEARIWHNEKEWVKDNPEVGIDVEPNGASLSVTVERLDACRYPCATTDLHATRNEELKAGFGDNPQKRAVFKDFVYATPSVGFKSEALPSLEVASMVTGGTASDDARIWLTGLLDELLGSASPAQKGQLLVQCRLGFYPYSVYSLIGEASEPAPVVMLTSGGADALTDIPVGAAREAGVWLTEVGGSTALGFWCVDVSVFRDVDGAAPQRILALRRVRGVAPTKYEGKGTRKKRANVGGAHLHKAL